MKTLFCFLTAMITRCVAAKELVAPLGFRWEQSELSFRLIDSQLDRVSEIFFEYDPQWLGLGEFSREDKNYNFVAVEPGQHLMYSHPDAGRSVEEEFYKLLGTGDKFRWVASRDEATNQIHFASAPHLEALAIDGDLDSLILEVQNKMAQTNAKHSNIISRQLKSITNLIEAVDSSDRHLGHRVDAFCLSPILELKSNGRELLDALQNYVRGEIGDSISWFIAAKSFHISTRLSVLMLVTHNHIAEDYFVRAVAIEFGMREAFDSFILLNEAYAKERMFWGQTSLGGNKDFFGTDFSASVDVSLKRRILPLVFYYKPTSSVPEYLPYTQLYHYYGGFILAYRMRQELGLPRAMVVRLNQAFGLTYKLITAGWNRSQLSKMSEFYEVGAEHAIALEPFIEENF